MTTLTDITAQLAAPFALDEIGFLPKGKVEREGKTLCMALPYADPRVYEDRLNALAPGEWSTPAPIALVAGNKLICYVTVIVYGVAHTDVGEATNNEENTGTEAWAQAFKRACSQFGLGRYLYDLEKEWVPFNPQKKQIDLDRAGLRAIARKMYQKAGLATPDAATPGNERKPGTVLRNGDGSPVVIKPQAHSYMEVKEFFLKYYKPTQWRGFKTSVLGMEVEDEGLTDDELAKLWTRLVVIDTDAKARGKAQVAGAN